MDRMHRRNVLQGCLTGLSAVGAGCAGESASTSTPTDQGTPDHSPAANSQTAPSTESPSPRPTATPGPVLAEAPETQWTLETTYPVDEMVATTDYLCALTIPNEEANTGEAVIVDLASGTIQTTVECPYRPWGTRIDRDRNLAVIHCHSPRPSGPGGTLLRIDLESGSATQTYDFSGFPFLSPAPWFTRAVTLAVDHPRETADGPASTLLRYDVVEERVLWEKPLSARVNYPSLKDSDRVYITTQETFGTDSTGRPTLQALDVSDGSVIWKEKLATAPSMPRLQHGQLYLTIQDFGPESSDTPGEVVQYSPDGTKQWATEFEDRIRYNAFPTEGLVGVVTGSDTGTTGQTPANPREITVLDDVGQKVWSKSLDAGIERFHLWPELAYVWNDETLKTFDANTGEALVATDRGPTAYPSIYGTIALVSVDATLSAIDGVSGTEYWSDQFEEPIHGIDVWNNHVFVGLESHLVGQTLDRPIATATR